LELSLYLSVLFFGNDLLEESFKIFFYIQRKKAAKKILALLQVVVKQQFVCSSAIIYLGKAS
jgi:hypothetical protein